MTTKIPAPTWTQIPNIFFDKWMAEMSEAELRIVLAAMRKILGWHKDKPEAISISQFVKLTGLTTKGALIGIRAAVERGLLVENGTGARGVKLYTLNIASADEPAITPVEPKSRPAPRTKAEEFAQAYWRGIGQTSPMPRYLPTEAADLVQMGATADEVQQMAAEKQAKRDERYQLAWLVEDWNDWKAEQKRKESNQRAYEEGQKRMKQILQDSA